MFDHFNFLAPFYERLIPPPDPSVLVSLLALTSECSLLDAAGGTGRVAGALAASAGRVVVCDAAPRMLEQARKKGLEAVQAELEVLPFADESFDRALLVDAFHHVRDQRAALRELLRVLKPGGRLVIEEPDIRRLPVKVTAVMEKLFLMRSRFKKPAAVMRGISELGENPTLAREGSCRFWIVVIKQSADERHTQKKQAGGSDDGW